jgi:hypothetical protein
MHTTMLETIEASLEAQLAAIRSLREKHAAPPKPKPERRKSNLLLAQEILTQADGPLHITEIMHRAQEHFGRQIERDSLVSAMVKEMHHGRRFVRTAPNTFALRVDTPKEA